MKLNNLLLISTLALAGCASSPHPLTVVPEAAAPVPGTELDQTNQENVRTSPVIQTLSVGPSVDPTDPNVRHDAHNVERVVEDDSWNLHPNVPTAINMGPIVAVTNPNVQNTPLPAELQQKIQEENLLLKVTTEQNDAMAKQLQQLQTALASKINTDAQNQELKQKVTQLEDQIRDLADKVAQEKVAPKTVTVTTEKKWWDWSTPMK